MPLPLTSANARLLELNLQELLQVSSGRGSLGCGSSQSNWTPSVQLGFSRTW
ncbi:hypothetical protein LINPERHAP1_LOCUS8619 [Linum perenne]